ncbi:MAG: hypothetical protein WD076_02420, partial [Parvularculaceae bacterium]
GREKSDRHVSRERVMAFDLSKAEMRRGKISEMDRSFDYEFWRSQSLEMKMRAIWEMTVFQHMVRHGELVELRLDRTVGRFRKKPR